MDLGLHLLLAVEGSNAYGRGYQLRSHYQKGEHDQGQDAASAEAERTVQAEAEQGNGGGYDPEEASD